MGIGGAGQALYLAAVPLDPAEALGRRFPFLPEAGDLFVGAADEVPPHQHCLGERRAAEQQHPGRSVARVGQRQPVGTGRQVAQLGADQLGAVEQNRPEVDEHAVLEVRRDVEGELGAPGRARAPRRAAECGWPLGRAGRRASRGIRAPWHRRRVDRRGHVVVKSRGRCRGVRRAAPPRAGRRAGSVVPRVETSECATPYPPVIRFSSPGRTIACTPLLSRCSISPANSQLTVCRPVCGCGGTSIPPVSATSSGP